jgi:non-specific protein-tyrosine kinase
MELLQYWKIIQKSWWILLLSVLLGLGASTYLTLNEPSKYESTATLLLNPSMPSSLVPYVRTEAAASLADSYTELMRTRSFAESVVAQLPFPISAGRVAEAINTRLVPNTLFYKISAQMETPEKAQQLVSTVVEVFLSANAAQQAASQGTDNSSMAQMGQRLDDKLKYLGDQIKSYQNEIKVLEAQAPSPERDDQMLQLRGQLVTLQQAETDTMLAIAQVGASSAQPDTALVIDQPLPGRQLSRNLNRNLGLGLVISLMVGVGLAFLRDYLDHSIRSPGHVEKLFGRAPIAVIGAIQQSRGPLHINGSGSTHNGTQHEGRHYQLPGGGGTKYKLVALETPRSPAAESFRILRTGIQFSSIEKPIRSIVVTSVGPKEGKTFVSANLAVVMAQAGKRVILVDADLRQPSLHELFNLPNRIGLADLIQSSNVQIKDALQQVQGIHNLAVITSGPLPLNPAELMNSRQAAHMVSELAKYADTLIFDSPPAGVIADPMTIATSADAVLLVMHAGVTRADRAVRVAQSLEYAGVNLVLPILNLVRDRGSQGYYYSYQPGRYESQSTSTNGHHIKVNGDVVAQAASKRSAADSSVETQDDHRQVDH